MIVNDQADRLVNDQADCLVNDKVDRVLNCPVVSLNPDLNDVIELSTNDEICDEDDVRLGKIAHDVKAKDWLTDEVLINSVSI